MYQSVLVLQHVPALRLYEKYCPWPTQLPSPSSTRRGARSECHVPSPPPTRRDLRVSLALLGRTWVKKNQEPPSPFLAGGTGRWAAVSAAGSVA